LTGRPPFRGETVMETLNQVQNLEPLPPVRLQPKVPLDLQTICLKALQKDPKKRYDSAGAMGEDLRRYMAGEPILARPTTAAERTLKWIKRHPAAATLIAVSSLAVVSILTFGGLWLNSERQAAIDREQQQTVLAKAAVEREDMERKARIEADELRKEAQKQAKIAGEEKQIADKQRLRAETNFQHAQSAVNEMLTKVGSTNLANEPRMEAIRRDLLKKALAFYLKFLEDEGSDRTIQYQTALAFHRVGGIYRQLGQLDDADKNYKAALDRFGDLAREQPGEMKYREGQATDTMERGIILQLLSRNAECEQTLKDAIGLFDQLAKAFPKKTLYQEEMSNLQANLGTLYLSTGRPADAEKCLDTALALRLALNPKLGKEPSHRRALAGVQLDRGLVLFQQGKVGEAEKSAAASHLTLQALAKDLPDDPDAAADAAKASINLGVIYRKAQHGPQALASLKEAVEQFQTLTSRYPLTLTYRLNLAQALYEMGMLQGEAGSFAESYKQLGAAVKELHGLPAEYASKPLVRLQAAQGNISLGIAGVSLNKLDDARDHYRAGIALLEDLKPTAATNPDACRELCRGLFNLAELYRGLTKPLEAEKSWERLLALREDLAQANPKSAQDHIDLAQVQENFAGRYFKSDKFAEARKFARGAARQWTETLALVPENAGVRQRLYDADLLVARCDLALDDHVAAAKTLGAAAKLYSDPLPAGPAQDRQFPAVAAQFGKCMLLADHDTALDAAQRKVLVKDYGDAALAVLSQAVVAGFKDINFLKSSPEFELLRMRSEFTRLVSDLEMQQTPGEPKKD
jgi:tetratricopeptide (TPR) repeat protein